MNFATSLLQRALEESSIAMAIVGCPGIDGRSSHANAAFRCLTGFTDEQLALGQLGVLHGEQTDSDSIARLHASMGNGQEVAIVIRSYRADGSWFWNSLLVIPLRDALGKLTHYLAILRDITQERRYAERLERRAHHDALTGLPNRHQFEDRLEQAIARAQQESGSFALVFVDVDHFKEINDTLGHDAGDDVLRLIGARLAHSTRMDDVAFRYGGDEFVLLLQGTAGIDRQAVQRRIARALVRPIIVNGMTIQCTCSVGVSLYPNDGCDRASLLRHADFEMYRDKAAAVFVAPWPVGQACGVASRHPS